MEKDQNRPMCFYSGRDISEKKTGLKKTWCKIKSFGKCKMKIFGVKRSRESEKEERYATRKSQSRFLSRTEKIEPPKTWANSIFSGSIILKLTDLYLTSSA